VCTQLQSCATNARAVLPAALLAALAAGEASEEAGRKLDQREEARLLPPLLRLRQACCHPQVGGVLPGAPFLACMCSVIQVQDTVR
jgi:hypothetical protein